MTFYINTYLEYVKLTASPRETAFLSISMVAVND